MENKKSNKILKEIKKEFEKVCDVFNTVQKLIKEKIENRNQKEKTNGK